MGQTLDKIQRLGRIVSHNDTEDHVLELTLNKILNREINKIQSQIEGFNNLLFQFEKKYDLDSANFVKQYEKGTIGDNIDYIEWVSTIEMKRNAEKYIVNLQGK